MTSQMGAAYGAVEKLLQTLTDYMYDKNKNSLFEKVLATAEEKTNVKREKLVYGALAILIIYVIFGALAQFLSNIVGFVYPAWRSIKAVRSSGKEDDTHWLIYWIVFSAFSIIDFSVFSAIPFYWLFKIAFLIYLYLPMFNGATVVYQMFIDPTCTLVESYFSASEPKKEK